MQKGKTEPLSVLSQNYDVLQRRLRFYSAFSQSFSSFTLIHEGVRLTTRILQLCPDPSDCAQTELSKGE